MGLTRKQWMTLVVIVVGTFITFLNQTLVTPALPSIMADTGVDAATGQWLTTGFTLVNAIMIPITAYLQDRFSIKQLFLFSMGIFFAGTMLCAWGFNFPVLLCGRLVQAMGAGILMPMSMTVLLVMFPIERRGSAMGIFGLVIAFAPAIGPTVSGIVVDTADWHIMFYVVAALVLIIDVLAAFIIPKRAIDVDEASSSLDVLSVVLSTLGFGGLLYGFSVFGSTGLDPMSIALTLVGLACVVWFFVRQTRLEVPMLRVKVLLNRNFLIATIIAMLVQAALLVAPVLMPIYIQTLMGYSATISGLVLMPGALAQVVMNPLAGKLFDRYGARWLGIIGMGVLAVTTLGFAVLQLDSPIWYITLLYFLRMVALSLVNMPINTWGMNSLDTRLMSHGTSINNTFRMVAGSLGTAVVVSVYSLCGSQLGPSMGDMQAQMIGVNVAFAICAAIVAVGFVLTVIFVKGKPGTIEATGHEGEVAGESHLSDQNKTLLSKIMKQEVYVLRSDDSVKAAMQMFINEGISACPIVDDAGNPVGFISDGDILKTLARKSESYIDPVALIATSATDSKRGYDEKLEEVMELPVASIGTKNLISVNVHADIDEVCRVLAEHHLKKVPVMENGKICGIINRSDITRYSMEAYLERRPEQAVYCGPDDDGTPECEEAGSASNGSESA